MTKMLASIRSLSEAMLVKGERIDIIDLKDPLMGALGALPEERLSEIVRELDGIATTSATIGDLPFLSSVIEEPIRRTAATGVDIVKVGLFSENRGLLSEECRTLSRLGAQGIRIVLVQFAEDFVNEMELEKIADAGVYGVMLDTKNKSSGSLSEKIDLNTLGRFIEKTKEYGLVSGLAGSLRFADVEKLLGLSADYLGFRGGICEDNARTQNLCIDTLRKIRTAIAESQAELLTSS